VLPDFELSAQQLVLGANGAGKTTLLWAIILAIRSFNGLTANSSYHDGKAIEISRRELSLLLNYPELSDCSHKKLFHRPSSDPQDDHCSTDPILKATIAGLDVQCTVKANGEIHLHPGDHIKKEHKVRFAFVGSSVHFNVSSIEMIEEILSTSTGNVRGLFRSLTPEKKEKVAAKLNTIFPHHAPVVFDEERRELYVSTSTGRNEIMFEGGAFRKVFTTLTYLMYLGQAEETERVLLMEEPEAGFYPSALDSFVSIVLELSHEYQIQLIVTTNAPKVAEHFLPCDKLLLQSDDIESKALSLGDESNTDLVNLTSLGLLDSAGRPVVIVEGKDDLAFIREVAVLLKKDITKVLLHSGGGQISPKNQASLCKALKSINPAQVIRFVRDPDFEQQSTAQMDEILWGLPSIESYLLIGFYTRHPERLKRDFVPHEEQLCSKFVQSYETKNNGRKWEMIKLWTEGWNVISNISDPSLEQLRSVAVITHGHTWAKTVVRKSTPTLIGEYMKDAVICLHDELEEAMKRILD